MFEARHEQAAISGLMDEWVGKQVAVFGDIQVGMWLNNSDTVRRVVSDIVDSRPAPVLITGDFVYHPTEDDSAREAREELDADDKAEAHALIAGAVRLVAHVLRQRDACLVLMLRVSGKGRCPSSTRSISW